MTCKQCIHHVSCNRYESTFHNRNDEPCIAFSDRSLWVKLPCKVGTTVYYVYTQDEDKKILDVGKIISFSIEDDFCWVYVRYESGLYYWQALSDFGRVLFFTREEAERAIDWSDEDD